MRSELLDISVHCDVKVFDWLMTYVQYLVRTSTAHVPHQHRQAGEPGVTEPLLSSKNVASILISSDFLKMDALVQACLQWDERYAGTVRDAGRFCHQHLNAILKVTASIASLPQSLVVALDVLTCSSSLNYCSLSQLFTIDELEAIDDAKDRIIRSDSPVHYTRSCSAVSCTAMRLPSC